MKTNLDTEKYFMAILGREGGLQFIQWFGTKKEARDAAIIARKNEPDQFFRKDIFYGKVLTE
jgi:hypothetical protein